MVRKFKISVNGKEFDVEVVETTAGAQIEAPKPQSAAPVEKKFEAPAPAAPVKAQETHAASDGEGPIKIKAPMPGTIVKINVEQGQKVKRGDVVLILEAMKMENEITCTDDGTVASINVSKGSRVNAGDVMVSIR